MEITGIMSQDFSFRLIGRGIYGMREASMLSRVPTANIRRWTRGYSYLYEGQRRYSEPVIAGGDTTADGQPVLTFADLLEVRFLDAFRKHGVSWRTIRIAAERAKEILALDYPFSSRKFRTDGRTILAQLTRNGSDTILLDLLRNQYAINAVLESSLFAGIEWGNDEEPRRWWPLSDRRSILIDPNRSMGMPIVASRGVPTQIVAGMCRSEGSPEAVADWFEISVAEVQDAVEFQNNLAA